jgi:peroxiredoxin
MRLLIGAARQLLYIVPIIGIFILIDRFIDAEVVRMLKRERPELVDAPAFQLPKVEPGVAEAAASQLNLKELKGEPVILNFWASWCTVCLDEKPYLDSIWKKRKKYHNRMIGIATTDEWGKVLATGRATPEHFPILLDRDGSVARAYGVDALPQTIVLDARGRIMLRIKGPVSSADRVADLERMFTADVMDAYAH